MLTEQSPLIRVRDLKIAFAQPQYFEAVQTVHLDLRAGETLAIVGESGSGKSLIALSLMGLQSPEALIQGDIHYAFATGENLSRVHLRSKDWQQIRGKHIGMIFQEPMSALNPTQTIGRQLCESIRQHQSLSYPKAKAEAIHWMEKVQLPHPQQLFRRYPHQLSGGQKQRVMIAMALCNRPQVLIADEPTTALDASVQAEIIRLMQTLQAEMDTAMLFITHDLSLAADIADNILVMQKGEMKEYGPTEKVLHSPEALYTQALLSCRPRLENKGKALPVIDDYLAQRSNNTLYPSTVKEEDCLSVNKLSVRYKEKQGFWRKQATYFSAVNEVSFHIQKGETLGLVGESGCGKSTIGKALLGLSPIYSGHIHTETLEIQADTKTDWNSVRKKMQLIFQDPFASLNPRHTVAEIVGEPLKIYSLQKDIPKRVAQLLDQVQLPESAAGKYPHQFSGGQRQRIGIARALALEPQILICDESVSALDISVQAQILNLLKRLQADMELSYLFISHDLAVVHYMADRIMVMESGKIVESGDADDIILRPQNPYTRKLIAAMPQGLGI